MKGTIKIALYLMLAIGVIVSVYTNDSYTCRVSDSRCKSIRGAVRQSEQRAVAYSKPAVYVISQGTLNLPDELVPYIFTPSCAAKLKQWPGNSSTVYLFKTESEKKEKVLDLKIGSQSFIATGSTASIKTAETKKIEFKNELPYPDSPDTIIMTIADNEKGAKLLLSMIYAKSTENAAIKNDGAQKLICDVTRLEINSAELNALLN